MAGLDTFFELLRETKVRIRNHSFKKVQVRRVTMIDVGQDADVADVFRVGLQLDQLFGAEFSHLEIVFTQKKRNRSRNEKQTRIGAGKDRQEHVRAHAVWVGASSAAVDGAATLSIGRLAENDVILSYSNE